MRHYFGYDIDGNLRSYESYGPAGWPNDHCLEDPDCVAESVASLRESRAKKYPAIINWAVFDCPCDPGAGDLLVDCACAGSKFGESYVDTSAGTLMTKPLRSVYVDGEIIEDREVITRAPGTVVNFKVTSVGMPDGELLRCVQSGSVDLTLEDVWTVPFAGGRTEEMSLVAPAQGTKGVVGLGGDLMRPFTFVLRGFVVPE